MITCIAHVVFKDIVGGKGFMRKKARVLVAAFFYYSGLVGLCRWRMQRQKPRVIILNYHRASAGDIRQHMRYLKRHYRVLHLEEALEELYMPAKSGNPARRTPVVLTFDDGYRDNYTHAFKAAVELQVPITIFIIPGYIDSGDFFWWGEGKRLVERTQLQELTFAGHTYHLHWPEDQKALSAFIDMRLRAASSVAERDAFLFEVRQALAVPMDVICTVTVKDANISMSWLEIAEMQRSGWVYFGAHTMNHPVLSYLTDTAEIYHEIAVCREVIHQHLEKQICTFAYPIGRNEHIGAEAIKAVQMTGYKWAVTTTSGFATAQSDPYRLERVLVDVRRHWLLLAAETSGIWQIFAPLWKPFINEKEDV